MIDITLIDLTDERDTGEYEMKAPPVESFDREKAPEGQYPIICTQVIDLGTHYNQKWEKYQRKIRFMFLTPHKSKEGEYAGKPLAVLAEFPFSMFCEKGKESNLVKFVQSWFGKNFPSQQAASDFDFTHLLKRPAFANIVHNEGFVNIQTIMPLMQGQEAPAIPADANVGIFDTGNPDMVFFEKLGKKTQEAIMASAEMGKKSDEPMPPLEPPIPNEIPDFVDDKEIPF